MSTVYISVVTAVGAFSVSALDLYLGYKLFIAGATGTFKFTVTVMNNTVGIESVAPGIAYAAFGMSIAIYALYKLIGKS